MSLFFCTSCSLGDTNDAIRARYEAKTVGLTIGDVRLRKAATGAAIGGTLGAISGLLVNASRHAKVVIGATVVADLIAVAILSEDQIYEIGSIVARERSCPGLIAREDLTKIGEIVAIAGAEMKQQIDTALDQHPMAEAGGIPAQIGGMLGTQRDSLVAMLGQLAPATAAEHVAVSVLVGAAFNSIALTAVGIKAKGYYEAKAQLVCKNKGPAR